MPCPPKSEVGGVPPWLSYICSHTVLFVSKGLNAFLVMIFFQLVRVSVEPTRHKKCLQNQCDLNFKCSFFIGPKYLSFTVLSHDPASVRVILGNVKFCCCCCVCVCMQYIVCCMYMCYMNVYLLCIYLHKGRDLCVENGTGHQGASATFCLNSLRQNISLNRRLTFWSPRPMNSLYISTPQCWGQGYKCLLAAIPDFYMDAQNMSSGLCACTVKCSYPWNNHPSPDIYF